MSILLAAIAAASILAVALIFLGLSAIKRRDRPAIPLPELGREREAGEIRPGSCVLCGHILAPGERLKSDLSPGRGDRVMRIFGCPRCWPLAGRRESPLSAMQGPTTAVPRICPVCRGEIPPDGWAVARYFERPGRRHVHVLGCTDCRKH